MNQITLLGRIGNDPEIKTFDNGNTITNISVATTERWKTKDGEKKEKTEWHSVVFQGDTVGKFFKKGERILLTGKITYQEKDGKYYTKIAANSFEFIETKGNSESAPTAKAEEPKAKEQEEEIGDLPF